MGGPLVGEGKLQTMRTHLERDDYLGAYLAFLQGSDVAASLHMSEEQLSQHFASLATANTLEWQAIVELLPTLFNEGQAADHLSSHGMRNEVAARKPSCVNQPQK